MKLSRLMEQLQDLADERGDPEVVVAYQESYPLAGTVDGATVVEADEDGDEVEPVVWIAVGEHPSGMSPYAPRAVFEQVGR